MGSGVFTEVWPMAIVILSFEGSVPPRMFDTIKNIGGASNKKLRSSLSTDVVELDSIAPTAPIENRWFASHRTNL